MFHVFYLIFMMTATQTDGEACKAYQVSIPGKALRGHTYKTERVEELFKCYVRCERAPACNSCNFKHTQKTCEMNNETKETKPNDFISDEQSYYLKQTGGGGYNCYSLLTQFRTTRNPVTSSWQLVKGSISSIKVGLQPVIACPYTSDICRDGSISLSEIICHSTLHSLIEGKVNMERTI